MENQIDISFFVANIDIPNTDNANIAGRLNYFITNNQDDFLRKVLGVSLFNDLQTAVAADGEDPTQLDLKWKNLLYGCTYTGLYGYPERWRGIVEVIVPAIAAEGDNPAIPAQQRSMIANYVYYRYRREDGSLSTGIGEVVAGSDSGTAVSSARKMQNAWNEMSGWIKELACFLDTTYAQDSTIYPDWIKHNRMCMLREFGFSNPIF